MLAGLHGWRRWHLRWSPKSLGLTFSRGPREHLKYCPRRGWTLNIWRLSVCFNCTTIEETRARYRQIWKDDIWPTVIVEDALDAEFVGAIERF